MTNHTATYAWVIDKTHDSDNDERMPRFGPHNGAEPLFKRLRTDLTTGLLFRLYDDDEQLIYSGRILPLDCQDEAQASIWQWCEDNWNDEEWFAPLDSFGAPNYGCTAISYFRPATGEWEFV